MKMKRLLAIIICTLSALLLFASCGENDGYVIAIDESMHPFSGVDSSGEPVGFEVDILKAIAAEQGFKVKYYPTGYPEALEVLEKGDADAVMAAVIPTDELAEKFDFTDMYYNNEYAVAVRKGKSEKFIEQFNEGLSRLNDSGKYKEIYTKYFG